MWSFSFGPILKENPEIPIRSIRRARRAHLCALILPSTGKRCGCVALLGQQFCRHHAENHLPVAGERNLSQRLDRLTTKMDAMEIPLLLDFLREKLVTMQKTLRRFPEVAHTLTYTLDRLEAAKSLKLNSYNLRKHSQMLTPQRQAILNKMRSLQARSLWDEPLNAKATIQ